MYVGLLGSLRIDFLLGFGLGLRGIGRQYVTTVHKSFSLSRDVPYKPIPGDPGRLVPTENVNDGFLGPLRLDILCGFGLTFRGSIGSNIKYLPHRSLSLSRDGAYQPIPGGPGSLVPA